MADHKLKLDILTPKRRILTTDCAWATIPGEQGELGILPEHLPLVTTLGSGLMRFGSDGKTRMMAVHYGYMTLRNDEITVLAEMVELAEEIDVARAKRAEERSREELQRLLQAQDDAEYRMHKLESKLRRALVRQQAHG